MDKSELAAAVYNKIAEPYSKEFSKPSEYIDEFLDLLPIKSRVLDAGCGPGIDSAYIESRGFHVIGVDLSEGMVRLAEHKFPNIDFRLTDIRNLDFPPGFFEGIVASCSLIHIPKRDIIPTLNQFHRLLGKDGIVYIALQGGKSEEIFINEPFKPDEKLFLDIFSFDEIKNLLIKTGFSIVKTHERKPQSKEELNFTKLFIIAKK